MNKPTFDNKIFRTESQAVCEINPVAKQVPTTAKHNQHPKNEKPGSAVRPPERTRRPSDTMMKSRELSSVIELRRSPNTIMARPMVGQQPNLSLPRVAVLRPLVHKTVPRKLTKIGPCELAYSRGLKKNSRVTPVERNVSPEVTGSKGYMSAAWQKMEAWWRNTTFCIPTNGS